MKRKGSESNIEIWIMKITLQSMLERQTDCMPVNMDKLIYLRININSQNNRRVIHLSPPKSTFNPHQLVFSQDLICVNRKMLFLPDSPYPNSSPRAYFFPLDVDCISLARVVLLLLNLWATHFHVIIASIHAFCPVWLALEHRQKFLMVVFSLRTFVGNGKNGKVKRISENEKQLIINIYIYSMKQRDWHHCDKRTEQNSNIRSTEWGKWFIMFVFTIDMARFFLPDVGDGSGNTICNRSTCGENPS